MTDTSDSTLPNAASTSALDPLEGVVRYRRRILLTGAAGQLGRMLRERLFHYADVLRVSDIKPLDAARAHEECIYCDLANADAVDKLVRNTDVIVHFGGVSVEQPFETVLPANIVGTYHVYEAARRNGVRRIVFASSNHVTGFYEQGERIDTRAPLRPDGYYGLSKAFGEHLAQFYYDRYGIESVCIRIGSSNPAPKDRRMLSTWLGYDDLEQLVSRAIFTPNVGCTIIYGMSENRDAWWDNGHATSLGYRPTQSSEPWREKIEASQPPPTAEDPVHRYQGAAFATSGPFDELSFNLEKSKECRK